SASAQRRAEGLRATDRMASRADSAGARLRSLGAPRPAASASSAAVAGTKPATVETGYEIQVPLFLETGTKVKVDTRTGDYLGRVN
ncbi:MAG TPA: hypothetical protein VNT50_04790, partial [Microbacterium sp.]|nr:hypothetical protein [Microbacterium sp.]